MARRYSRIRRGGEYQNAQNKKADYDKLQATVPQNKTSVGGTVENPNPRRSAAVLAFGTTPAIDTKIVTTVSVASDAKLGNNLSGRYYVNPTDIEAGTRLNGFYPAKVHYFEPDSDLATVPYVASKVTGLYYPKRTGKTYTCPFGAKSKDEEEQTGANEVKKIVVNINTAKTYRRVWISAERIQI